MKRSLMIIMSISFVVLFFAQISRAIEFDLTLAQDAVGQRFASKFCEAKEQGSSSESSSEFALNNTYLKFVSFPDDEKFIEKLWNFTIEKIKNDCGQYVTEDEEINLREFFEEEGEIARNRSWYLPN